MKIKASELDGAALDWAVAKCEGYKPQIDRGMVWCRPFHGSFSHYCPTTDWSLGGPIIEQERFAVWFEKHDDIDSALPIWFAQDGYAPAMQGSTPLIAAMRCYVAGMLGDEVEVPDCLIEVNHE